MKLLVLAIALCVAAPTAAVADSVPAPTIKLVGAGKGTKKQLRFVPKKGAKSSMVMTSQQAVARGLKGKLPAPEAAPAVKTTIDIEVLDVTADGDIKVQFTYRKSEVVPDKRTKPELAKQVATALEAFAGLTGTAIVTSRGLTKEVSFTPPASATREVKTAIETAKSVATQLAQPLPEEAVGVGAKWQTTSTATGGEVTAETVATYELVASTANTVKLKTTLTVKGKGSGTGNLTTDTTARGETSLDLASVVPTQSKLDMRTEVGLDADGKRLAQLVTTKTTLVGQ